MLTSLVSLAAPLAAAATAGPFPSDGPTGGPFPPTGFGVGSAAPFRGALAHFGPWGPGYGGGPGWLFLLIPLFWIGLIALIISLAARRRRRFWAANGGQPGAWAGTGWGASGWGGAPWGAAGASGTAAFGGATADAEKTLAERFARGDIDEQEYRARLEVLQSIRQAPPPAGPVAPTKA